MSQSFRNSSILHLLPVLMVSVSFQNLYKYTFPHSDSNLHNGQGLRSVYGRQGQNCTPKQNRMSQSSAGKKLGERRSTAGGLIRKLNEFKITDLELHSRAYLIKYT